MRDGVDAYTLLCEKCGYVLERLPVEGTCPECGRPVAESLPGHRDHVPTMWEVLLSPRRSLDRMPIEEDEASAWRVVRRCAAAALIMASSVPIGLVLSMIIPIDRSVNWFNLVPACFIAGLAGVFGAILLILLTGIESLGLRTLSRWRGGRIDGEIASTICSHGSVGWIVGGVFFAIGVVLISIANTIDMSNYHDPQARRSLAQGFGFTGIGVAGLGLIAGFLVFEVFAWLGLRRCAFANRARPDQSSK